MLRASWLIMLLMTPLALTASGSGPERPVQPLGSGMARIEGGSFRPLFGQPGEKSARIKAFALDTVLISEAEFLTFVKHNPDWSAARVPALFADPTYLAGVIGKARRPVTKVSWFAATAYCRARGARLPTTNEWEYAARASESHPDASNNPAFKQRTLELAMQRRSPFLIGSGLRNLYGVRDLHGGVMEWTLDSHTIPADPAARHADHGATCAAGTAQTGDASDYAAFMRYAFRSNAQARSNGSNVGFRCAQSL